MTVVKKNEKKEKMTHLTACMYETQVIVEVDLVFTSFSSILHKQIILKFSLKVNLKYISSCSINLLFSCKRSILASVKKTSALCIYNLFALDTVINL